MLSIDDVLNNHIKMGPYQARTVSVVGLIEFCDGIELAFMTILMAILKKEWDLSQAEVASLGAIYWCGIAIGNYFCAMVTDTFGRKTTLTTFMGISVLLILYTSIVTSFTEIMVVRLFFGLVFGVNQPLGYIFITEVVVSQYRGRFGLLLTLLFVSGKIYLVCLCYLFLDDYTTGNWRGLIRFNCIPVAICFFGALLTLQETIRFQMTKGNYMRGFQQINQVAEENNGDDYPKLTVQQRDEIVTWQLHQHKYEKMSIVSFRGLFSSLYIGITVKLWIILLCANLQHMSIFLLMPFLFDKSGAGFSSMLWLFVTELIASWGIYLYIDNPKVGRVKILVMASILLVLSNLALLQWRDKALFIGMLSIKVATRALFSTTYILSCESYVGGYRTLGSAMAAAVGRCAGIPAPYIMFPLFFIDPYLPFLFNSIVAIILLVTVFTYPIDKTQKPLETTNTSYPSVSLKDAES